MDELYSTNFTPSMPDEETMDRGTTTGLLIFLIFIVLVGVPGNCLILRVYWGKSHKTSTRILIMGLAMTDLMVCLLKLWEITWHASTLAGSNIPNLTNRFLCFVHTGNGTSIVITAAIALDRYDCVCRFNRRMMTHGRAKGALLSAVAASVAVNIPLYIKVTLGTRASFSLNVVMNVSQITLYVTALAVISACYGKVFTTIRKHVRTGAASPTTDLGLISSKSDKALSVAAVPSSTAPGHVVSSKDQQPSTSLSPDTIGTIPESTYPHETKMNESHSDAQLVVAQSGSDGWAAASAQPPRVRHYRRRQSTAPALQRRTTTMLFLTSVVFILSWLPYWVRVVFDICGERSPFLETFLKLLYVNNAVNPFIYGLANRRFRQDCRAVFRKTRG